MRKKSPIKLLSGDNAFMKRSYIPEFPVLCYFIVLLAVTSSDFNSAFPHQYLCCRHIVDPSSVTRMNTYRWPHAYRHSR